MLTSSPEWPLPSSGLLQLVGPSQQGYPPVTQAWWEEGAFCYQSWDLCVLSCPFC